MLILEGRYGSIEPTTGLSYTELEYDYGISHGKPTFAVVITEAALEEKVKVGGTQFIEKVDPKALAQFREKVLKNISSFFSDPKDIKLCVYESMSDYAANPDLKGWIAADEVLDTKSLQDEIKNLRDNNAALNEEIQKLQGAATMQIKSKNPDVDDELLDVLKAIEVTVPAKITKDQDVVRSLFSIAYNNRDRLINGVTNAAFATDSESFFYFNILPKLQAHGLADNEKVAGAKYRRSFLNKKGQAFFAAVEKRILRKRRKKGQSANPTQTKGSNAQASETSAAIETDAVDTVEVANNREKEKG
jgi:hypothetical protein